ncbi:MAG: ADP-ribosylglycohydrolase family protein [Lachnospiraceae bacterium]|nr:ADP-ribosylglycohydrolase family protein [Lachnospiraceae bacterium]
MTVAIAEALINAGRDATFEEIAVKSEESMRRWGRKYIEAGYGAKFIWWLMLDNLGPYNSYGNGSAMRVSAAGWLFDSIERTREAARATAAVSHNHPEGIKGAEATASVIFLSRTGKDKGFIKKYIEDEFDYNLRRTCDEIRPGYYHTETCQETVPEAITAFLEGDSFDDVVRTAVSLGGDCDTLTAIAASMAEAYYGMPKEYVDWIKTKLPDEFVKVLQHI